MATACVEMARRPDPRTRSAEAQEAIIEPFPHRCCGIGVDPRLIAPPISMAWRYRRAARHPYLRVSPDPPPERTRPPRTPARVRVIPHPIGGSKCARRSSELGCRRSAFVTPSGLWHAHDNESGAPAHLIPGQDAGLHVDYGALDIRFYHPYHESFVSLKND